MNKDVDSSSLFGWTKHVQMPRTPFPGLAPLSLSPRGRRRMWSTAYSFGLRQIRLQTSLQEHR